jgi:hypothetical protein
MRFIEATPKTCIALKSMLNSNHRKKKTPKNLRHGVFIEKVTTMNKCSSLVKANHNAVTHLVKAVSIDSINTASAKGPITPIAQSMFASEIEISRRCLVWMGVLSSSS